MLQNISEIKGASYCVFQMNPSSEAILFQDSSLPFRLSLNLQSRKKHIAFFEKNISFCLSLKLATFIEYSMKEI